MGGAEWRQPVRGGHRPSRPGGRQGGGRPRHLRTRFTTSCCRCPTPRRSGPATWAGSMCGGPGMDLKVSSTIGYERASQPLLQVRDEDDFVRQTTAGLGPQPPNFKNIVALNRGPLAVEAVDVHPLTPRQVEQTEADGAMVVDVRTELQFDEAHIPSAVCITALRGGFGTRLAWLAELGAARAGGPRRRGRPRGRRAGRRRGAHQHRRLSRRRHDLLARGEAAGRARSALERGGARRALGRRRRAERAPAAGRPRAISGRRPHPRRPPTPPTTTSTSCRTGSTPASPSR